MAKKKAKKAKKMEVVIESSRNHGPFGPKGQIWLTLEKTTTLAKARKTAEEWAKASSFNKGEKIVDVLVNDTALRVSSILIIVSATWRSNSGITGHLNLIGKMFKAQTVKYVEGENFGKLDGKTNIRIFEPHSVKKESPRGKPSLPEHRLVMGPVGPMYREEHFDNVSKVLIGDNPIYIGDEIGATAVMAFLQKAFLKDSEKNVRDAVVQVLNDITRDMQRNNYPDALVISITKMLTSITINGEKI